jgi:hypothetical protein
MSISNTIKNQFQSPDVRQSNRRRLCIHEAGHLLVGYFCGLPMISYEINDSIGAHLEFDFTGLETSKAEDLLRPFVAQVSTVSMSGIVAEALIYGDCQGGAEDWPLATRFLRIYCSTENELDDYRRGAIANALIICRLHLNILNEIAEAMDQGKTTNECFMIIENLSRIKAKLTKIE